MRASVTMNQKTLPFSHLGVQLMQLNFPNSCQAYRLPFTDGGCGKLPLPYQLKVPTSLLLQPSVRYLHATALATGW